jgi:hypothetical protein
MLTVAAEVGADDFPDAVTDGDGGADMRRAGNRRSARLRHRRQSTSWAVQID